MKILKFFPLIALTVVFAFNSCTKPTPPQLKVIPSDAVAVISIKGNQLAQKGGFDASFFDKFSSDIAEIEDTELRNTVAEIIKNPKQTGIDAEYIFVYVQKKNDIKTATGAAVLKLSNAAKFEENLAKLIKNENKTIESKDGYKLVNINEKIDALWNNELLLINWTDAVDSLHNSDFASKFSIPADKSILSVADFQDFLKKDGDVAVWFSYSELMNIYKEITGNFFQLPAGYDVSGLFCHAYLNFENGEMKLDVQMTPKAKADEMQAKYPVVKTFNNKLLDDFPATTFFVTKLGFNLNEYIKLMKEMFKTDETAIDSTDEGYKDFEDYENYQAYYMHQQMAEMQKVLDNPVLASVANSLEGDVLLNIYGFAQGTPLPLFGIDFTVKDEAAFDNLFAFIPAEISENISKTDKYYVYSAMGFAVYCAYKDKRVLISNDEETINAFVGKGLGKTLKNVADGALKARLTNDNSMFYLNLDLDTYPASIKSFITDKQVLDILSNFKDFSYGASSSSEGYLSIRLKDTKQNSLKTIVELVGKYAE